jgi:hypothetical protein
MPIKVVLDLILKILSTAATKLNIITIDSIFEKDKLRLSASIKDW